MSYKTGFCPVLPVCVVGHRNCLQPGISSIFGKLDINGDGELDEVEFIGGCLDDSELVRLLNGSKVLHFYTHKIFFHDDARKNTSQ